jgi:hypothetical protein
MATSTARGLYRRWIVRDGETGSPRVAEQLVSPDVVYAMSVWAPKLEGERISTLAYREVGRDTRRLSVATVMGPPDCQ